MARVELKKAVKRFGEVTVIHGVDLDLNHGEFVVFVGPSGCGKSTLLRMIAGLEELSHGEVHIADRDVSNVAAVDRGIAMVFQSYALYPHMTVGQNMGFGLRMNGVPKEEIEEKVGRAAKTLQLEQLLDRKPRNLSGGQRQRVAIGRAIVRDPDVFLFDEPLSNLDAELRVEMRLQIARLHKKLDATMIYVTHDQVEAMTMADKIVVLRAGLVEQVGSPLELYQSPDNLFVAGFIGSPRMNFMEGTILSQRHGESTVTLGDGNELTLPLDTSRKANGSKVTLGVRPEDLVGDAGNCQLPMQVDVAERLGGTTYLYGKCGGLDNFVVERPGMEAAGPGDNIQIAVPSDKVYLFDDDGLAFKRDTDAGRQPH
ncbi:MAG: sn-glycerol-3-phosphate ABC transporter ATP-binding protein UgpC [Granulosicoccus sp.]|nr:sn-glycerol-3-phosphate ABC transporter ATP-binding protein UgpC [Granulosicoccus sp.]